MKILLHICCSNCALYPVKLLRSEKHSCTGFWFNPNIHPAEEYDLRLDSLKKLADEWKFDVACIEEYTPEKYFKMLNIEDAAGTVLSGSSGLNGSSSWNDFTIPPFPERCRSCYQLRLEETARHAQTQGFDAFSTTLLISPYQDFDQIISTGRALAETYNVRFHEKDYRPYFRDAMDLSKELGLYRQKYCGCVFSKEERKNKTKKGASESCQSEN